MAFFKPSGPPPRPSSNQPGVSDRLVRRAASTTPGAHNPMPAAPPRNPTPAFKKGGKVPNFPKFKKGERPNPFAKAGKGGKTPAKGKANPFAKGNPFAKKSKK